MKPAPKVASASEKAPTGPSKSLNDKASESSQADEEVSPAHDDKELVSRVQAGDPVAFRTLFDRYNRRAYAVAFGVVKNQDDALDVMQEAFIKVHKHIGGFQGTSSFYTWLYRIVMNLAIDHLRRKRKVTEFDETIRRNDVLDGGAHQTKLPLENPGKVIARTELSQHIQAALAELPEYHRAVILLREIEGLSYEEMAQVLDVPKGTIMSRLFHARRKMQERLQPYLSGDLTIPE